MPADKYFVLRRADLAAVLTPDQMAWIVNMVTKVNNERVAKGKSVDDLFFVLNASRDRYAQAAMEAYIEAINGDPAAANSPGAQQALAAAREMRMTALLKGGQRIPD